MGESDAMVLSDPGVELSMKGVMGDSVSMKLLSDPGVALSAKGVVGESDVMKVLNDAGVEPMARKGVPGVDGG